MKHNLFNDVLCKINMHVFFLRNYIIILGNSLDWYNLQAFWTKEQKSSISIGLVIKREPEMFFIKSYAFISHNLFNCILCNIKMHILYEICS